MKVMLGGALREGAFAAGLSGVLERLGHAVMQPRKNPVGDCQVFVAFVDYLHPELLSDIQDAIEADKPVLCLTDGRLPVESDFLVAACRAKQLDLAHYRDFEEMTDKLFKYVGFVSQRRAPSSALH